MKLKSMTSVITKSALVLAACASLNAFAGAPSTKASVAPLPEEDAALFDTLGVTLDLGYDSRYYWRGLYRADNTLSTGVSLGLPVNEQVNLKLGARYLSNLDSNNQPSELGVLPTVLPTDYRELALGAELTYDVGVATLGLSYTNYQYYDSFTGWNRTSLIGVSSTFEGTEGDISSANEIGLSAATAIGPVNLRADWYYNLTIGGSYAQVGANLPVEITPWLSIVPEVAVGYGFDYFTAPQNGARAGGWTHVIPSISAPIKLTKTATLTPYVAYNLSLDSRHDAAKGTDLNANAQDSEFFGGVRLSVSF